MPHLQQFDRAGTHRLIPARFADEPGASVLETLPLPPHVLSDLSELDAATNERAIAERGGNPAIGPGELLFGVPEAAIVNAAFTHPGPFGGRFHSPQRGAWYAAFELETSIAEVAFHRRRFLADARIAEPLPFDYQEFLADFSGAFHALDAAERKSCLQPDPVPQCYAASQSLATRLLFEGSNGIVYPSVRRSAGTCLACFRPALVFHPRRGRRLRLTLAAGTHTVSCETTSPPPAPPSRRIRAATAKGARSDPDPELAYPLSPASRSFAPCSPQAARLYAAHSPHYHRVFSSPPAANPVRTRW